MKLTKWLIVLMLSLTMSMALFACTPTNDSGSQSNTETPKTPTIDITSEDAEIEVGESYLLAYTATDSTAENVAVQDADGEDVAGYDAETKQFTPTDAGVFTITVTAENGELTANDSVTVTAIAIDETAPTITFSTERLEKYTMVAGESVELPSATASDDTDGDLTVDVSLASSGATLTANETGYTFSTFTAGQYYVSYYAVDTAENEAEEFLLVEVGFVKPETTVTKDENNLDNLTNNNVEYKENFQEGYAGTFAKALDYSTSEGQVNTYIASNENSIDGNSLFLDYTKCSYNTNTGYFFSPLTGKISSGLWTISMDIKILGGTVPNGGFYYSFIFEGDVDGDNTPVALGEVGKTKTVTYEAIKNFDDTKTWHFRTFTYCSDSSYEYTDFVLVIDNISFTRKDVVDATAERTGTGVTVTEDMLDGGYTITGEDQNYTEVAGLASGMATTSMYLHKDKLVDALRLTEAEVATLTASNGFNSNYPLLLQSQMTSFSSFTNLVTNPEYTYTLEIRAFATSASGWNFFITNGSGAQAGVSGIAGFTGVKTLSYEFDGNASYINLGLYNGGNNPLYIGDITLSRKLKEYDPTVVRTDTAKVVTEAEISATNGYKLTGGENNYTAIEGLNGAIPTYVDPAIMVEAGQLTEAQKAELTADNGFGGTSLIKISTETNFFTALNGLMMDANKDYTITIKAYVVSSVTGTNFHIWTANNESHGSVTSAGVQTLTATIAGNQVYNKIGIYVEGFQPGNFILIGDITLSSADRVVSDTTPNGHTVGKTWTLNADDAGFTPVGGAAKFTKVNKADISAIATEASFGTSLYKASNESDSTNEMFRGVDYTEANCDYSITFNFYVEEIVGKLMIRIDNNFIDLTTATGVQSVTINIRGAVDFITFYTQGGSTATTYLSSVSLELTAIN